MNLLIPHASRYGEIERPDDVEDAYLQFVDFLLQRLTHIVADALFFYRLLQLALQTTVFQART